MEGQQPQRQPRRYTSGGGSPEKPPTVANAPEVAGTETESAERSAEGVAAREVEHRRRYHSNGMPRRYGKL